MGDECPAEELLVALAEGHAPAAQLAALHGHLDVCGTCRALVADLAGASPASGAFGQEQSVPVQLDEYQLVRPLGRGAMGTVYLAYDTALDREVAIKWIARIEPATGERSRFLSEARAIARLQHENVASVYRVGQIDGQPYLVYEYVRGQSLDRLPKPVPSERLLKLAIGLCRGLDAAHRRGVLHRDLKPANAILGEDGTVKLLDFGLAKLLPRAQAPVSHLDPAGPPGIRPRDEAFAPALQDSGVVGTPLYMAPEIWRGEAATPQADLYSLGALLYELATGQPPVPASSLAQLRRDVQEQVLRPAAELAPGLETRFAAVIDRCLCFDPAQRFASAEELGQALALLPIAEPPLQPGGNPYRGLSAFDAEHRALFYGRSTEIREVVELLLHEGIVVISGDSGVGKSSLCRAGVLPLCQEGGLGGGRSFRTATLVPGPHPLLELAAVLGEVLSVPAEEVLARLRSPVALAAELAAHLSARKGLLLFVDQMEELVSTSDLDEAAAFTQALRALADGVRGLRVLIAVRGDFLSRVAALPGLWELVRGLYLLRPLSASGLREAIVKPARLRGVAFESEALVEELIHETLHAEGGLPLLSFALAELWEARAVTRRMIPATALAAIGGVSGALSRHADALLRRLKPAEQVAVRRLLVKLVTAEGLRVRRSEADLGPPDSPAGRVALKTFLDGRLLVARVVEGASVYELAHETLVSGWGTLRAWLLESREARELQQRLDQAVTDWERLGQGTDALWGARQLGEARPLLSALELSSREQAFLLASQKRLRYRLWMQRGLLFSGLLLALLLGATSYQKDRAERLRVNRQLTQAREMLSSARRFRALSEQTQNESFAAFKGGHLDRGEDFYGQALAAQAAADRDYAAAMQLLEAELLLSPRQPTVRSLYSTILGERALLSERRHKLSTRDELILRLRLYDADGEAYKKLAAPVSVYARSWPQAAAVTLARYDSQVDGRRSLGEARSLSGTPESPSQAMPGSYLLTLTAVDGRKVRFPLLIGLGEPIHLDIGLPPAEIPADMVYIPAGRFLYGSSADEGMRHSLLAEPLHAVNTAAYLIARHETTFSEYITYLRALSPTERARRLPHAEPGNLGGGLALSERKDGAYELTLQAGDALYRARSGESIHYKGRDRRAAADWLRFPVMGISFEDAQAYAAWLAATGTVPRARLCSEYEWERAARGADDREYPHGDVLSPDDANYAETYHRDPRAMGPDEVGAHPASASPFGLDDMIGNALEWVSPAPASRCCILRGGAYNTAALSAEVSTRLQAPATLRSEGQGMRVCADLPPRTGPAE